LCKDENGKPKPVETVLSNPDDYFTCQCLDYILVINRNKQGKYDKNSLIQQIQSTSNYSPQLLTEEQIPTERKGGDLLTHFGSNNVGGPAEKRIFESPINRNSDPKEVDRLKGE